MIEQAARESTRFLDSRACIKICPINASDWGTRIPSLTIDDAIRILEEKVTVLVENACADWNFIRGIMKPPEKRFFKNFVDEGWVEPLHGGGDTLTDRLHERSQSPVKSLRTFVLFDSDRLHPNEFSENWTPERPRRQPASCKAYHWELSAKNSMANRYWMLKRRTIESYMPKKQLIEASENKTPATAVDAFYRMESNQRWFYNMKEGFVKDRQRDDSERCRDLYANLSPDDLKSLEVGFGKTLARKYADAINFEFEWDDDARNEADNMIPNLLNLL